MSFRNLLLAGALLHLSMACAQDAPTPPPNTDRKQGERVQRREQPPAPVPGTSPMAGSPREMYDPNGQFPDAALGQLLLDPSQTERIKMMDRRYNEELALQKITDTNDARYRKLWEQRSIELKNILTTSQYARWQQLAADQAARPVQPLDKSMPVARPDSHLAPMPTLRNDTLRDAMPVVEPE